MERNALGDRLTVTAGISPLAEGNWKRYENRDSRYVKKFSEDIGTYVG